MDKKTLVDEYKNFGATIIGRHLGVSKRKVLYWLHKYKIPVRKKGGPKFLPEYWKNALRKPKSKVLRGSASPFWKPENHITEKIRCKCGCGFLINKYDKRGRKRFWARNHCPKGYFTTIRVKGANNSKWKGGVTLQNEIIRKSKRYELWRSAVYKRDFYTCQECGIKRKDIIAHHIKNFADFPDLRFVIENGITLCRSCHFKEHLRISGKGKGNRGTSRQPKKR
jgi:5-methylcytosine-specific restriction endonuclease McrA